MNYDIKIKEMGNNNCHLHAEDTVICHYSKFVPVKVEVKKKF